MSKEIGKQIAEKFAKAIEDRNAQPLADQRREKLDLDNRSSLVTSIKQAVEGLNSDSEIGLTLEESPSSLAFKIGGAVTLTIRFGSGALEIIPDQRNKTTMARNKVSVRRTLDAPAYQFQNTNPTFNPPILSQEQFVTTIVKVACGLDD